MSQSDSRRIYRVTTDSEALDLPRALLTSGALMFFVPILSGVDALTGGGATNLDGIPTDNLALPSVVDLLAVDDSFSRWVLRAKRTGEVESTDPADANKTLIVPDDDDTLIWARITGGSSVPGGFSTGFSSGFR